MKKTLLGKKIGMTKVFDDLTGKDEVITVVDVSDNVVSKIIVSKDKNTVSHIELGKDKSKKYVNSEKMIYKTLSFVPKYKKVIKVGKDFVNTLEIGKELGASIFNVGENVNVTGVSKGKGFAGVVKRWGFSGGPRTHGQSDRLRAPGSIGSGTTPGRVVKGKKMAGRMGRDQVTVQNLKIVVLDVEKNLLGISGAVPGFNGSYIVISEGKKR